MDNNINQALRIHPSDNVYVALSDLMPGQDILVNGNKLQVSEPIPAKQKFSNSSLRKGEVVRMYGVTVGEVTRDIPAGGLLSRSNLQHKSDAFESSRSVYHWDEPDISPWAGRTFEGFHRSNGSVGTANTWIFVPMVFCENKNIHVLRDALNKALGYEKTTIYQDYAKHLADMARKGVSTEALKFGNSFNALTNAFATNANGVTLIFFPV